jgi:hypothetical protein
MSNEQTLQKVAEELTQRIGQVTANYEGQLAVLRVQAQEQIESLQAQIKNLQSLLDAAEKPVVDNSPQT